MGARAPVLRRLRSSAAGTVFCVLIVASSFRAAPPPSGTAYPEKGKVVSVRVHETIEYAPITPPDSKGRTHGGEAFVHRNQIYRVQTPNEVYELEGGRRADLIVGDTVEFRVRKNTAEIRLDGSTKKYRIVSRSSVIK